MSKLISISGLVTSIFNSLVVVTVLPANLSEEQTKLIRESSRPFVKTERKKQEDGNICVELPVNENGVVYFELNAGKVNPDRGYDYDRVVSLKA